MSVQEDAKVGTMQSTPASTAIYTGDDGRARAHISPSGGMVFLNRLAMTLVHEGHCTVVARDASRVAGRAAKIAGDAVQECTVFVGSGVGAGSCIGSHRPPVPFPRPR